MGQLLYYTTVLLNHEYYSFLYHWYLIDIWIDMCYIHIKVHDTNQSKYY